MVNLIDSSLWVDLVRPKTPEPLKRQVQQIILDPSVALCEPVRFELLFAALSSETKRLEEFLATVPLLQTPPGLWPEASRLGQRCVSAGFVPRAMDLLIAQIALHHHALLVTFDKHFQQIAKVSSLQVNLLTRAG